MPGKRRPNRKPRPKSGQRNGPKQIPASTSVYTGPAVPRWCGKQTHTDIILCWGTQGISSNGASPSIIATVFDSNPSNCANWSDLSAVWSEFRVLAIEVLFKANNRYNKTTQATVPIWIVPDRVPGALTSGADACDRESAKLTMGLDDGFKSALKMSGTLEAEFQNTSSPVAYYYIKLFATGLTASTNYGVAMQSWLVQFRNIH